MGDGVIEAALVIERWRQVAGPAASFAALKVAVSKVNLDALRELEEFGELCESGWPTRSGSAL